MPDPSPYRFDRTATAAGARATQYADLAEPGAETGDDGRASPGG